MPSRWNLANMLVLAHTLATAVLRSQWDGMLAMQRSLSELWRGRPQECSTSNNGGEDGTGWLHPNTSIPEELKPMHNVQHDVLIPRPILAEQYKYKSASYMVAVIQKQTTDFRRVPRQPVLIKDTSVRH